MKHYLLGIVALVLLSATSLFAGDWNQWLGPNRNGVAVDSPPLINALPDTGLKPLWKSEEVLSARSGGWGSPIVSQGKVYVFSHQRQLKPGLTLPKTKYPWLAPDKRTGMSEEEYAEYEVNRRNEDEAIGAMYQYVELIYCFDLNTGKTLWTNKEVSVYTRFLHSGSPVVIDGKLYLLGAGRFARCIDANDGKSLWKQLLPGEFRDEFMMSSFAVTENVAAILAGHLFGLDANTGKILWEGDSKKTSGTHTSPVVWKSNGQSYFIVNVGGDQTICVEPKTGNERWRIESQAGLSTPILHDDLLITYGNSRKKGMRCFKMSPEKAEELWVFTGAADKGSSPVLVGDSIFVQGERRLACVNLADGKQEWSILLDLAKPQYTSLISADGKVFYTCDGVLMFEASKEKFRPLAQAKMNQDGLLATEDAYRKMLGMEELEKTPEGKQKALKLYEQTVGKFKPLACATPAIADGKLIIRMSNAVVCYDLTQQSSTSE